MMGDFHFLRPWWWLALVPCALLVWAMRRRGEAEKPWRGIVAPHLLPFLLQGETRHARFTPLQLIAACWVIGVLAMAGPTWRREPAPFADDTAALAILIKVTPSMTTEDVQPSRLGRSVQKIQDLLKQRRGAKTALIAYAGSAHVVMPATTDEGIIDTFAGALDPKIMPIDGDAAAVALTLADRTLAGAGAGSILWITDSIAAEQTTPIEAWHRRSGTTVRMLTPLPPGGELDAVAERAQAARASMVALTADDSDIDVLARAAKFATVAGGEKSDRWEESGYWLTPLLVLLILPFFRRGWMAQTANQA